MSDVRALLAAERQSRRIVHSHLSYTKSGMLMCNVCSLNVKSESLWEGHLKSANHRKNVASQASRQASLDANTGKGVKRKIEDVDEAQEERDDADTDARKKPKSRPESTITQNGDDVQAGPAPPEEERTLPQAQQPTAPIPTTDNELPVDGTSRVAPTVDEDEWAAFEREVAPLATEQPKPDYSSATITAAPVTADQMKAQEDADRRRRLETEAEDEREDELGKMAEEFEVMEEMEERVRKLREKREALRSAAKSEDDTGQPLPTEKGTALEAGRESKKADEAVEEEEEEEDEDDWYS